MFSLYTSVSLPSVLEGIDVSTLRNFYDIKVYNKYDFHNIDENIVMSSLFLFKRGEVLRELTLGENEIALTLPERIKFKEKHLVDAIELFSGERPDIFIRRVIVGDKINLAQLSFPETFEEDSSLKLYFPAIVEGFTSLTDSGVAEFYHKSKYSSDLKNFISLKNYFKKEGRNPTFLELTIADRLWQNKASFFNAAITDIEIDTDLALLDEAKADCEELNEVYDGTFTLNKLASLPLKHLSATGETDDIRSMDGEFLMEEKVLSGSGSSEVWMLPQQPVSAPADSILGALGEAFGNITSYGVSPVFSLRAGLQPKGKPSVMESRFRSFSNTIGGNMLTKVSDSDSIDSGFEHIYTVGAVSAASIEFLQPKEGDYIVHIGESITALEGGDATDGEVMRKLNRFYADRALLGKLERSVNVDKRGVVVACFRVSQSISLDFDKLPRAISCKAEALALCSQPGHMISAVGKDVLSSFMELCVKHGLTPTVFGSVTNENRLRIKIDGNVVCDFSTSFLAQGGYSKEIRAMVYDKLENFKFVNKELYKTFKKSAAAGTEKAVESFYKRTAASSGFSADNSSLALLPYGGKYQKTMSLASGVWLSGGRTLAVSSYGTLSGVAEDAPFLSGVYSVVLAVNKLVALGVEPRNIKLALSASFPKLGGYDEAGYAVSYILGAVKAQLELGIPSLKNDFTEGNSSFVCFSSGVLSADTAKSNVFEKGQKIFRIPLKGEEALDFKHLAKVYGILARNIEKKTIKAVTVVEDTIMSTLVNSLAGNGLGLAFAKITEDLFVPSAGDFIVAVNDASVLSMLDVEYIGMTDSSGILRGMGVEVPLHKKEENMPAINSFYIDGLRYAPKTKFAQPKVLIPAVAGVSGDYVLKKCFDDAGANSEILSFSSGRQEFLQDFAEKLLNTQILALPSGSDLSAMHFAALLKNAAVADSLEKFLSDGDGLILGLGSGFKALMDSGLLGERGLTRMAKSREVRGRVAQVTVSSNLSMWSNALEVGQVIDVPLSTAYGKFTTDEDTLKKFVQRGQIAMQYCDDEGKPSLNIAFNPYGSTGAAEAITSRDGRIFGRAGNIALKYGSKNYDASFDLSIFESGVKYFS